MQLLFGMHVACAFFADIGHRAIAVIVPLVDVARCGVAIGSRQPVAPLTALSVCASDDFRFQPGFRTELGVLFDVFVDIVLCDVR